MRKYTKQALLINPPIVDFAAFDFWIRPVGLLSLGAMLQQLGWSVSLVDCLDRFHPALVKDRDPASIQTRPDGRGKFYRQIIEKPEVLHHIPRYYSRYGLPSELFEKELSRVPDPDLILVTSMMTYWYPAVREVILACRSRYPKTPVLLGGVYATLCTRHAMEYCRPDAIIAGEGEQRLLSWLFKEKKLTSHEMHSVDMEHLPYPAYDLYPHLPHAAILASKGCPMQCSFCASHRLCDGYRRLSTERVVAEILHWAVQKNTKHFAFYDDALLFDRASSFKTILRKLLQQTSDVQIHLPNGIQPRHIDTELAELMFAAGVKTIRLSLETTSPEFEKVISNKVRTDDVVNAITVLQQAGFQPNDIGVYVLMGLPDQTFDSVRNSVEFVNHLGAVAHVASFSPIPGTKEWEKAIKHKQWDPNTDMLLTNNSIFPVWSQMYGYHTCHDFLHSLKIKQSNSVTGQYEALE